MSHAPFKPTKNDPARFVYRIIDGRHMALEARLKLQVGAAKTSKNDVAKANLTDRLKALDLLGDCIFDQNGELARNTILLDKDGDFLTPVWKSAAHEAEAYLRQTLEEHKVGAENLYLLPKKEIIYRLSQCMIAKDVPGIKEAVLKQKEIDTEQAEAKSATNNTLEEPAVQNWGDFAAKRAELLAQARDEAQTDISETTKKSGINPFERPAPSWVQEHDEDAARRLANEQVMSII